MCCSNIHINITKQISASHFPTMSYDLNRNLFGPTWSEITSAYIDALRVLLLGRRLQLISYSYFVNCNYII